MNSRMRGDTAGGGLGPPGDVERVRRHARLLRPPRSACLVRQRLGRAGRAGPRRRIYFWTAAVAATIVLVVARVIFMRQNPGAAKDGT